MEKDKTDRILLVEEIIVNCLYSQGKNAASFDCATKIVEALEPPKTVKLVTRDASTGRFVSKGESIARPKETVVERIMHRIKRVTK